MTRQPTETKIDESGLLYKAKGMGQRLLGHALFEGKRRGDKRMCVTMCTGGGMDETSIFLSSVTLKENTMEECFCAYIPFVEHLGF